MQTTIKTPKNSDTGDASCWRLAMERVILEYFRFWLSKRSLIKPDALNALMICRALERVADHATNIAEDVIFWVQGADVRHSKSVALHKDGKSHAPSEA